MRARALASTSLLPLSRLEPPLADSGERKCADQPPRRASRRGASGNVSRAVCLLLGVSLVLELRAAPLRDQLDDLELGALSEPYYRVGAMSVSFLPHSLPLGHLRPRERKELAQSQTVTHN